MHLHHLVDDAGGGSRHCRGAASVPGRATANCMILAFQGEYVMHSILSTSTLVAAMIVTLAGANAHASDPAGPETYKVVANPQPALDPLEEVGGFDRVSVRVSLKGLNMASPGGQEIVHQRIASAARRACDRSGDLQTLSAAMDISHCRNEATKTAWGTVQSLFAAAKTHQQFAAVTDISVP